MRRVSTPPVASVLACSALALGACGNATGASGACADIPDAGDIPVEAITEPIPYDECNLAGRTIGVEGGAGAVIPENPGEGVTASWTGEDSGGSLTVIHHENGTVTADVGP